MKIGFTGTQRGMTDIQFNTVKSILISINNEYDKLEFHHGDCIGSDEQFHRMISSIYNLHIVIHPPTDPRKRAFSEDFDFENTIEIRPTLQYLKRNKAIVNECDILIATPSGKEKLRSGTWSTVRYARAKKKNIVIIFPDGETITED
mgnify:CR=1 FL=1